MDLGQYIDPMERATVNASFKSVESGIDQATVLGTVSEEKA